MGRQSFIHIDLRRADDGGHPTDIRVGGRVVPVMEGVLRLPEAPVVDSEG
jgi:predicted PhzF superfamily epimerase YddE/YHI9